MSQLEQLAEAKKRTKRKTKKESGFSRIWLVGSREWTDKRSVKKVLQQFNYTEVDFILLGTSPGLEQLALSICRKLKFNVILLPPNLSRDGINAIYHRNYTMFSLLKPTHVYGFHDKIAIVDRIDDKLDSQTKSTLQLLKLARAKKLEQALITTKVKKNDTTSKVT